MGTSEAARGYQVDDPEAALKFAIRHIKGDRVQIIEGVIEPMAPSWDHENTADLIREQLGPRARTLECTLGSGDLDLVGSSNWFIPDLAVVPRSLAKGAGALRPDQTLLVVEVTSESNGDTDRLVKRRRYAEYGAPLYLLVDRQERTCALFSEPGPLGYTQAAGPYPFGTDVRLPEPFGLELRTDEF
ncbi:Uma2 family endonuclease [Kitasatospora sp. NBC_01287]|uniref:Uma2 family endonuclease n=1 Tax=Kitasatospora sp. NBC_01287 TaxID=2903573 RepID=UPI002255D2B7|nr:Uma2 family endonuclease [Kitasatospora sp. NBC_01287]MCX4747256.1 Uma2 family endonuclease [Kitasatospora sp. NBC_01287]